MISKLIYGIGIAAEAILHNRTRALLTSLGIIFGVASVIAMLAIGAGAQKEILEQIRLLGAQNVIVSPIREQKEGRVDQESDDAPDAQAGRENEVRRPYSPGLTLADAESIKRLIPSVEWVSPEIVMETFAIRAGLRRSTRLVGVDATYFLDGQFNLEAGRTFTRQQLDEAAPVAIIGQRAKHRFFPGEEPLGKQIKCGSLWLTVVGVLEQRHVDAHHLEHLGLRDYNNDIYVPARTVLVRFRNRASLTEQDIQRTSRGGANADPNYHQIDRLVVRVSNTDLVAPVAEVVSRMLERRHHGVVDFQVIVPEVLLQQERRTQSIFNIVLAAIASISLLVGGIGIMNIMLASVLERIKEIGIRRSMGATRQDVVTQFLMEATAISVTGGVIGVLLGVGVSLAIERATGIATVITWESVVLAFAVSVSVGLVFGFLPARRAAAHDPVVALRYE